MSPFLYIVFHCFTGTDFFSSCHICSVLETVSESQRGILYAVVWPKEYGMAGFLLIKRKKKRYNPPIVTPTLTPKFTDSPRFIGF